MVSAPFPSGSPLGSLSSSETLHHLLEQSLTNAPFAIAIFDSDMRYVKWSRIWAQYHGRTGEDLRGRSHYEIFPDIREDWRQVHRRVLAGETVSCEEDTYQPASGGQIWIRWFVWPLRVAEGSVGGIAIYIEDITDRKRVEADLRKGSQRQQQITSALGIGVIEHDFNTGVTETSEGYLRLLDISRDRLPSSVEGWIDLLRPKDVEAYMAARRRALDPRGGGTFTCEVHPIVNGQERTMLVQSRVTFQGEGTEARPERMVGILVDQSDSRRLQEALFRAQRLETVGRMAGIVAHDFNNILTVILGNLELAMTRVQDEEVLAGLRNAVEAAEMGAGFNKRLLTLAGGHGAAPVELDLDSHLSRTWEIFRRVLSDEIDLRFEPGAPDCAVLTDPAEIDGALLNLVANARDAQPDGGQIVIRTEVVDLDEATAGTLSGGRAGRFLRLGVSDCGGGMTAEIARNAFEPFFTTKGERGGTGLGLTSVAMAAQRANGFLGIRTAPGAGTEISIFLPVIPLRAAGGNAVRKELPLGDGQLVLVVEDDPLVREIALRRLEAIGYAVIEAGNGDAALALLQAGEPVDLVLSDVVMPGRLSGYDLMREVRRQFPHVAVLLTSGHVSHAVRPAEHDDATEVLRKPYPLRAMAEAVARALNRSGPSGAPVP